MLKFNNSNIFTGYIKQLLADFNLPLYKVYTKEDANYYEANKVENYDIFETVTTSTSKFKQKKHHFPYIKNGSIWKYVYSENDSGIGSFKWEQDQDFIPGKKVLNKTKNLKIKNNIYDTYTHEYLGDYLRFLRDYYRLDLMPLYNCFNNKICDNLLLDIVFTNSETSFSYKNTNYKIYAIPVKLYKNYTIAIDCDTTIEMCCGLYNKYYYDVSNYSQIPADTYQTVTGLKFNHPILYTKLTDIFTSTSIIREQLLSLAEKENDLKLFIKVPATCKSSIVILEGDYRKYNDAITLFEKDTKNNTNQIRYKNHTITNFENNDKTGFITTAEFYDTREFIPITKLELLSFNTGESYPFATKLIEYLVGNAITELDELPDNTKRIQEVLYDYSRGKISSYEGIWDPRIPAAIYEYMNKKYLTSEINHDTLGYIDKVAERRVSATDMETQKTNSIANIDIYDNLYLDQKD